jgi:hypothetical protein
MTSFIWLMLLWHDIFYFYSFCIAHTLFLKNSGERFMIWSFYFGECTWFSILGAWNFSQHRS